MVNFRRILGEERTVKPTEPLLIFDQLDKESGKEYLRPPQRAVLEEWASEYTDKKDVIVKLHTGQGKTLIGLLMLQTYLNRGEGPAMYICPNTFLVDQTIEQAQEFGLKVVKAESGLPNAFINSEAILVTTCSKLFNARSVFGVKGTRRDVVDIGALVIDDAHKCLEIIRETFSIRIPRFVNGEPHPVYVELWNLFEDTLHRQKAGTCADIKNGHDCFLGVPFWAWFNNNNRILDILSSNSECDELKWVWNLLKDHILETSCIFSGDALEISPRLLPIEQIPSFVDCSKRIFLSATLSEDAFLVRDLGVDPSCVESPISSGDVEYSGERLILLPSLVDSSIEKEEVINLVNGIFRRHRNFGVFAITPSIPQAHIWEKNGGEVIRVREIWSGLETLKRDIRSRDVSNIYVLVNAYDGVDLPDSMCRILILDSLPKYNTLSDSYMQEIMPKSDKIRRKLAQRVEQGMGRSIRGFNDWCIVLVVGTSLTNFLSAKPKRKYLSNEARLQVEIGEELVEHLQEEQNSRQAIVSLIEQSLSRDEDWKAFYRDRMSQLRSDEVRTDQLEFALVERDAELLYKQRQYAPAASKIDSIINTVSNQDKGWYFQLKATYLYPVDRQRSMDAQLSANRLNSSLYLPEEGISYSRLTQTTNRASKILTFIRDQESHNAAILEVRSVMDDLKFGYSSDKFEEGLKNLGVILGFTSDRPEKQTREGPDNLWNVFSNNYWIIECKNQVESRRETVSKKEAGQMNVSIGWFKRYYEGDIGIPVFIHPGSSLADGVYVNDQCWVLTKEKLESLKENTIRFFQSLTTTSFDTLTTELIQQRLNEYSLDNNDLVKTYLARLN